MKLNTKQLDFLTEVINIGIGRSANVLNKIVSDRVKLNVPVIRLMHVDEIICILDPVDGEDMFLVSMVFM